MVSAPSGIHRSALYCYYVFTRKKSYTSKPYRARYISPSVSNITAGNVLFERLINDTSITLGEDELVPYERYTLSIAFQNHVTVGPEERIGFHMLQSSE